MMPGLPDDHPSISYYDGDYPGTQTCLLRENLDRTLAAQGLSDDIERFVEIVEQGGGRTLEIGCGTGRVLIPIARHGHEITGIDISPAMIERLRGHLSNEERATRDRIQLFTADARDFSGEAGGYATVIIPFNGLSCISDRSHQIAVLQNIAQLLAPGGQLTIDLVNPFVMPIKGNGAPQPFFTRTNPETGRCYTRFAAMGPIEADQTQRLFGWYDEMDEDGAVYRKPYEMRWRLIFPSELTLMIESVGLKVRSLEGDHRRTSYSAESPKIFMIAEKSADRATI